MFTPGFLRPAPLQPIAQVCRVIQTRMMRRNQVGKQLSSRRADPWIESPINPAVK